MTRGCAPSWGGAGPGGAAVHDQGGVPMQPRPPPSHQVPSTPPFSPPPLHSPCPPPHGDTHGCLESPGPPRWEQDQAGSVRCVPPPRKVTLSPPRVGRRAGSTDQTAGQVSRYLGTRSREILARRLQRRHCTCAPAHAR